VLDNAPESQTLIWVVCMFVRQRLTRHAKNADLNANQASAQPRPTSRQPSRRLTLSARRVACVIAG
jgi:hypothetical protein